MRGLFAVESPPSGPAGYATWHTSLAHPPSASPPIQHNAHLPCPSPTNPLHLTPSPAYRPRPASRVAPLPCPCLPCPPMPPHAPSSAKSLTLAVLNPRYPPSLSTLAIHPRYPPSLSTLALTRAPGSPHLTLTPTLTQTACHSPSSPSPPPPPPLPTRSPFRPTGASWLAPPLGAPNLSYTIQFESSGRWPDGMLAVHALCTSFYLRLAASSRSRRASSGGVFREPSNLPWALHALLHAPLSELHHIYLPPLPCPPRPLPSPLTSPCPSPSPSPSPQPRPRPYPGLPGALLTQCEGTTFRGIIHHKPLAGCSTPPA